MKLDYQVNQKERQNKNKARLSSTAVLLLLLVLFVFPFFTYPDPKPEQEGILVNLGFPDQGQGSENAAPAAPSKPQVSEPTPPVPEPTPPQPEPIPQKAAPQPEPKDVVTTEDPEAIALKKQQEEQRRAQEAAEQRRREEAARKEAVEEAERKQREAAERKRREEQARKESEANKLKDQLGGLFNNNGEGKGNTGTSGSQGDPNGDPDASKLEGITTGSGKVGGGLAGRGGSGPQLSDKSQKSGQLTIRVCINSSGKVVSADFTQQGSYGSVAADQTIIRNTINNAKKWNFDSGTQDKQCGTITYVFKLK